MQINKDQFEDILLLFSIQMIIDFIQLHHPGSKQQLEEVWEKQDHMDQQFDPKAFFMLHGELEYH